MRSNRVLLFVRSLVVCGFVIATSFRCFAGIDPTVLWTEVGTGLPSAIPGSQNAVVSLVNLSSEGLTSGGANSTVRYITASPALSFTLVYSGVISKAFVGRDSAMYYLAWNEHDSLCEVRRCTFGPVVRDSVLLSLALNKAADSLKGSFGTLQCRAASSMNQGFIAFAVQAEYTNAIDSIDGFWGTLFTVDVDRRQVRRSEVVRGRNLSLHVSNSGRVACVHEIIRTSHNHREGSIATTLSQIVGLNDSVLFKANKALELGAFAPDERFILLSDSLYDYTTNTLGKIIEAKDKMCFVNERFVLYPDGKVLRLYDLQSMSEVGATSADSTESLLDFQLDAGRRYLVQYDGLHHRMQSCDWTSLPALADPLCDFSTIKRNPDLYEVLQFKALVYPFRDSLIYHWDFGDGTTSSERDPKKSYSRSGTFNVQLKITLPSAKVIDIIKTEFITVADVSPDIEWTQLYTTKRVGAVCFDSNDVHVLAVHDQGTVRQLDTKGATIATIDSPWTEARACAVSLDTAHNNILLSYVMGDSVMMQYTWNAMQSTLSPSRFAYIPYVRLFSEYSDCILGQSRHRINYNVVSSSRGEWTLFCAGHFTDRVLACPNERYLRLLYEHGAWLYDNATLGRRASLDDSSARALKNDGTALVNSSDPRFSCAVSADERFVVTIGHDSIGRVPTYRRALRIYDASTFELQRTLPDSISWLCCLSNRNDYLLTATRCWNLKDSSFIPTPEISDATSLLMFPKSNRYVLAMRSDKEKPMALYDFIDHQVVYEFGSCFAEPSCFALSHDGRKIVMGHTNGVVSFWSIPQSILNSLEVHDSEDSYDSGLRCQPNPTRDLVRIYAHEDESLRGTLSLSVYDLRGQLLCTLQASQTIGADAVFTLDSRELSDGVYLCVLRSSTRTQACRVQVMH